MCDFTCVALMHFISFPKKVYVTTKNPQSAANGVPGHQRPTNSLCKIFDMLLYLYWILLKVTPVSVSEVCF